MGSRSDKAITRRRSCSLGVETLESRIALDGASLVDDAFSVRQNGPQIELDLLANDRFPPDYVGAGLITSVSYGSEGGQIAIAPGGGGVLYTPPADFAGEETFVYAVDSQQTANVRVTIQAPLAADTYVLPPDSGTVTLDVMENDPFWLGYAGPREITAVSVGSNGGVVEIAPDAKSIRYAPSTDPIGDETFVYVVDDLYPARVTIEVPNPLEDDEYKLVQHDPPRVLNVLSNDPFWEGYAGEKLITHVTGVNEGAEVEVAPNGKSLIYAASTGSDYLTYVVDGQYEARVLLEVYRPVRNDSFEVDLNSTNFYYNVTANDAYYDGAVMRDIVDVVTSVTQPESGGVVQISANGLGVRYTPAPGFTGVDTFSYTADGKHEATVRVSVTMPVRDDSLTVYQDTPSQLLAVLGNDFLGNGYAGARVITSVGPTESGGVVTISGAGKALLYTPALGFTGSDRFTYRVDHALTATVTLSVKALAQSDSQTVRHHRFGDSYSFNVLANDYFHLGYTGPGIVTDVELVSGAGAFTSSAAGDVTFTPSQGGVAEFRYTVDGQYQGTHRLVVYHQTRSDFLVAEQNSQQHEVHVLDNDFISNSYYYSYVGPRLLTGVTQSTYGGLVTFDPDANTVEYTPPEDFFGRDSFTYSVDGFWIETVSVEVVRLVRDDEFRVDSGDGQQALPVLVNDLFGADYTGVGQITGVVSPSSGAAVQIAADGQSILYTPANGFVGTDTFVYTVDGRLKAEVSVVVDTPVDERFPTFDGVDDYFDFLLDDALERYSYFFGSSVWGSYGGGDYWLTGGNVDAESNRGVPTHSETNVQVAGVDEGDIVEFDSGHVYALTDDGVTIFHAWPAEELSVASRVNIEGRPIAEFLYGDRLTIISETGGWYYNPTLYYGDTTLVGDFVSRDSIWPPYPTEPAGTVVTVIDVSDPHAPAIVQTTTMEGSYVDSRSVDGQVYTLLGNAQAAAPLPEIVDEDNDPTTANRYETQEEYVARLSANRGEAIEAALPSYTTTDGDGQQVRTGLLNTPETIHQPLTENSDSLISIVSIDATSDAPGLSDTAAIYSTGAGAIYASLDNFYVFDADYTAEDGAVTRIAKFDWDPASGGVEFAASTTVAGRIINQFSADENGDYLRLATTVSNSGSGNWSARSENMLFVLSEDDGVLESVGSIQNWALGESIRSVRFLGDRAFVTTFRQIDPLFALDLSDPANPEAVGHITLPGFTSYMHLVDQDHLLTVGQNTSGVGAGPTQVSLFDISDLGQPLRLAEHTFSRFSTSEAEIDHHAFGYFAEHGLLAMPVASSFVERVDLDGDGYSETRQWSRTDRLAVFHVDVTASDPEAQLWLGAEIEHNAQVRRSGYIGDTLYSVGRDVIQAVDMADLSTIIAAAPLSEPQPEVVLDSTEQLYLDVALVGESPVLAFLPEEDERAETIAAARAHLAERLGLAAGEPLLVSAETTRDAPGGGETIALRAGDQTYWYRIGDRGRFEPATDDYRFDSTAEVWNALAAIETSTPHLLPGDYNHDLVVDQADYDFWRQNYGEWSLTERLAADGNADGFVDLADYTVWRDNQGNRLADDAATEAVTATEQAFASLSVETGDARRSRFSPSTRSQLSGPGQGTDRVSDEALLRAGLIQRREISHQNSPADTPQREADRERVHPRQQEGVRNAHFERAIRTAFEDLGQRRGR